VCAGTAAQGSFFSLAYSRGWLPLTVNTKSPPALVIAVAVSVWVCIASMVTTTSLRSKHASRSLAQGISLLLDATANCPKTAPARWSRAATRCGASRSRDRAPRTVLPSIAITRRWSTKWVRVHRNAPITRSRTSASTRANARRIADSLGRAENSHPNPTGHTRHTRQPSLSPQNRSSTHYRPTLPGPWETPRFEEDTCSVLVVLDGPDLQPPLKAQMATETTEQLLGRHWDRGCVRPDNHANGGT